MWYIERYSILLGLLLLPYAALAIKDAAALFKKNPLILILPFLLLHVLEFNKIYSRQVPILPSSIKEVAHWLKLNASPQDKIIISPDAGDDIDQDIIVRSGISPRNFMVIATPLAPPSMATKEYMREVIAAQKPKYLILKSSSRFQKIIDFDLSQPKINGLDCIFDLVYRTYGKADLGYFYIYKILLLLD